MAGNKGTLMSMYSELLTATVRSEGIGRYGPDQAPELLEWLSVCRRLLEESTGASDNREPSDDIAANIAYDLALLRLCVAVGVESDPTRFDRPMVERTRLERELSAHGFELNGLGPTP
jgi:hypothetical protein